MSTAYSLTIAIIGTTGTCTYTKTQHTTHLILTVRHTTRHYCVIVVHGKRDSVQFKHSLLPYLVISHPDVLLIPGHHDYKF